MQCDVADYEDGTYYAICSREKMLQSFTGTVSLTDTGRVVAAGPCDSCGTLSSAILCAP